jgi:hypothetical protein
MCCEEVVLYIMITVKELVFTQKILIFILILLIFPNVLLKPNKSFLMPKPDT